MQFSVCAVLLLERFTTQTPSEGSAYGRPVEATYPALRIHTHNGRVQEARR